MRYWGGGGDQVGQTGAKTSPARRFPPAPGAPLVASAVDFVLEGLYAQKKIGRSDERGYSAAPDAALRRGPRREETLIDESFQIPGGKKKYYN